MTNTPGQALIVEDQADWRQVFSESVQEVGLTPFAVANKDEALDLLNRQNFKLAIIDINLTDVFGNHDGLLVIETIKTKGDTLPIIVVSGSEVGLTSLKNYRQRVFAAIRKENFNLDEFVALVEKALVAT
jgi:DNA-binding NtrC family response regulator